MITKDELQEAINECLGASNPNANTCIKLAAFYIIADHLTGNETSGGASHTDSEFMEVVKGKPIETVIQVMNETMSVLQAANPMLYDKTIKKLM